MVRRLLLPVVTLALLAACGGQAGAESGDRLKVVTAFYPLQFLSERIGGDRVSVSTLTKPGAEPHDVELNPRQVGEITEAKLVVYLGGFQPAVDDAVKQQAGDRGFDTATAVKLLPVSDEHDEHEHEEPGAEEHEHAEGGMDPHVWLDPERYAAIAGKLAERLGAADPEHAAEYTERATAVQAELTALDKEFTAGLATCERHEVITSHESFGYLADRYGLTQIGITGISPETEPSPQRLAHVAEEARATKATTIYFETLVSPKVAETLATEVGAKTAVLDPLEGLTKSGADYFTVMRDNLAALTTGLGCSAS